MSRRHRALWRSAATTLLLVVVLTWVPLVGAKGDGTLTRQYPLGTQTLCCEGRSAHSRGGSAAADSASNRGTASTGDVRGHGGIPILLLVAIALIACVPAAFIFRAGLSPRGGDALRDLEPATDDALPPGHDPDAAERPSADLGEVPPNAVENGDVAFNLGVLLYERGHLGSAEAAWRQAAERHHARAATRLGMALERRGDLDGAREAYRDAERWGNAAEEPVSE